MNVWEKLFKDIKFKTHTRIALNNLKCELSTVLTLKVSPTVNNS